MNFDCKFNLKRKAGIVILRLNNLYTFLLENGFIFVGLYTIFEQ